MTETNTPSVEGDRLEAIARVIAATIYGITSDSEWSALFGYAKTNCLETARQIAALPCKGGEAMTREEAEEGIRACRRDQAWQARWMAGGADEKAHWRRLCAVANGEPDPLATPTTEPDTGRGLREARTAVVAALTKRLYEHDLWDRTLGPYSEASAGAFCASLYDQALAALSDTHETTEKQA